MRLCAGSSPSCSSTVGRLAMVWLTMTWLTTLSGMRMHWQRSCGAATDWQSCQLIMSYIVVSLLSRIPVHNSLMMSL